MKDRIQNAFDDIRADEALLQKTITYLQAERSKLKKEKSRIRPSRIAATLAAVLVLAVGIFGYQAVYVSAAAYVSIDVNPSIELTLNRMDRVIGALAYNDEGEALLQEVSLKGKPYEEAASSLLAAMEQEGYLTSDALVTVTVQTEDSSKEEVLCDTLLLLVSGQLANGERSTEVEVFPVTQELRETAHGCHMSAAKYLAIQELLEVDEAATLEEYSDSTIQQIRQRTQACRQGQGEDHAEEGGHDESPPAQGNGHHHGEEQSQPSGQGQGSSHDYRRGK